MTQTQVPRAAMRKNVTMTHFGALIDQRLKKDLLPIFNRIPDPKIPLFRFKHVSVLTVRDVSKMSKRGRASIAAWLRRQALFIEQHGEEVADRYRARYLYDDMRLGRLPYLFTTRTQKRS